MANCTIHHVDQRSDEWRRLRAGVLTASVAGDMMAKPLKSGGEPACLRDLRLALCVERITGQPAEDGFVSKDMQRGIELEPEAVGAYQLATDSLVMPCGFVTRNDLPVGCSPDGVIDSVGDQIIGGLEVKCPKSTTHLSYLRNPGKVPADYWWQIVHSLFVTGAEWWDFASFDPRFPESSRLFIARTYAKDVDLAAYEVSLRAFLTTVDKELIELAPLLAAKAA